MSAFVTVEIDDESKKRMTSVLNEFVRLSGKEVENGIELIAVSAAKRLANNVQRFGLTNQSGDHFQSSIGNQVYRAIQHANVMGTPGQPEEVHNLVRRKGVVPKSLVTQGQFKRDPISVADRETLARKKKALAGRAKGAWIEAGNKAQNKKMTRIPAWVNRHNNSGYGDAKKSGIGLKHTIELENKTPYLRYIQPDKKIAEATGYGLKSGFKRLETMIKKMEEKANREMK